MNPARAAATACLLALALASSSTATAQEPPSPRDRQVTAAAADTIVGWLPPEHWTRSALARMAATRHTSVDNASLAWPARRATVRHLLALAAAAEPDPTHDTTANPTAIARAWLDRFDAEFAGHDLPGPLAIDAITLGVRSDNGRLLAGQTLQSPSGPIYPGPASTDGDTRVYSELGLTAGHGTIFDLSATAMLAYGRDPVWTRATAGTRFGPVELWFGRREASFGPSPDGLVLSGVVPFDGGGLDTPLGFRLPGFLSGLGTIRVNQVVSRFRQSGDIRRPWFVATRVSVAPTDRLSLGINRAALFGGEGNEPVTVGRVLLVMFGITDSRGKDSDFENQVASLDVAWNVSRSVLLRAEYGFDDAGTSFVLVPGLTLGVLWASPGWAPSLSIGGSVTGIASSCCGHPAWYVHAALSDGWTDRGVLLGHPLGGNGLEAGIDLAIDPATSPVIARGRLFIRQRGSENLFSPDREGTTTGLEAWLQTRLAVFRVEAGLETELGSGRDRWRAEMRASF